MNLWLATLRASGRSPATLSHYRYVTGQFQTWLGRDDIDSASRFEAVRFVQHLQDTYRPSGVLSRLKALRAFYNWLAADGDCSTAISGNRSTAISNEQRSDIRPLVNPFRNITIHVPDDPRPTATADEINKMLEHAKSNRRDFALITLLVETGARKGEVAALTMADVNIRDGVVTFPVSKSQPRTVPLTDKAVSALARWLRYRGVGSGGLWSVGDPYSLVTAACRRHSATLTPHTLRRAFAVSWLSKGGSEVGLMRVCGWRSREMISVYTRASGSILAMEEMRRLLNG